MSTHPFTPFRIIMRMITPMVFSDFAPTLDGVLFEALSKRYPEQSDEQLRNTMLNHLAYHQDWGVYHASSAAIGIDDDNGLVASSYTRNDSLLNKLSTDLFSPNKRGGKYSKVNLSGGPTKQRLVSRPAYAVPYVAFDGFGDPWSIKTLLETYVLGIGYDAQNVQCGAFSGCEIIALTEDLSLMSAAKANRPLPTNSGALGEPAQVRLIPPYYYGAVVSGVTPPRVRAYHIHVLLQGAPL
ncbi:hypothetical protein D3C79_36400 [compost metagenome]